MSNEQQDFVLGEEVTSIAKSKKPVGTVVFSVRLGLDEAAKIDRLSRSTGKSVSQIIRDAVASYNISPESDKTYASSASAVGQVIRFDPVDESFTEHESVPSEFIYTQ